MFGDDPGSTRAPAVSRLLVFARVCAPWLSWGGGVSGWVAAEVRSARRCPGVDHEDTAVGLLKARGLRAARGKKGMHRCSSYIALIFQPCSLPATM